MKTSTQSRDAKHGEKTIEIKIRFWTDQIAAEKGKVLPRHAWTSGVVHLERNEAHSIRPSGPIPFNSLMDLGVAIEKALIAHGVTLHASRKMKKYMKA